MIEFTIALEPRTKKNSMKIITNHRTGHPMLIPSDAYRLYEIQAGRFIPKSNISIDYPVEIEARFYMRTKRKVDLTNLLEALDDILVHYNVIADDNSEIVFSHDGSRVFRDAQNPRTEVIIREK